MERIDCAAEREQKKVRLELLSLVFDLEMSESKTVSISLIIKVYTIDNAVNLKM